MNRKTLVLFLILSPALAGCVEAEDDAVSVPLPRLGDRLLYEVEWADGLMDTVRIEIGEELVKTASSDWVPRHHLVANASWQLEREESEGMLPEEGLTARFYIDPARRVLSHLDHYCPAPPPDQDEDSLGCAQGVVGREYDESERFWGFGSSLAWGKELSPGQNFVQSLMVRTAELSTEYIVEKADSWEGRDSVWVESLNGTSKENIIWASTGRFRFAEDIPYVLEAEIDAGSSVGHRGYGGWGGGKRGEAVVRLVEFTPGDREIPSDHLRDRPPVLDRFGEGDYADLLPGNLGYPGSGADLYNAVETARQLSPPFDDYLRDHPHSGIRYAFVEVHENLSTFSHQDIAVGGQEKRFYDMDFLDPGGEHYEIEVECTLYEEPQVSLGLPGTTDLYEDCRVAHEEEGSDPGGADPSAARNMMKFVEPQNTQDLLVALLPDYQYEYGGFSQTLIPDQSLPPRSTAYLYTHVYFPTFPDGVHGDSTSDDASVAWIWRFEVASWNGHLHNIVGAYEWLELLDSGEADSLLSQMEESW